MKDAHRFLARHQASLSDRPAAIFTLGPTRAATDEWQDVRAQMDKEIEKYPWIDLVAAELFGGAYDPSKLRFPDSLLAILPASPLHQMPASDLRDWEAIRAWASNLAAKLELAGSQ